MKVKLIQDCLTGELQVRFKDESVYERDALGYLYSVPINDEIRDLFLSTHKNLCIEDAPCDDYIFYASIPEEWEIDIDIPTLERLLGEKLYRDFVISSNSIEMAMEQASAFGYVIDDNGNKLEPDAPDSPLRKYGLI